MKVVKIGGSLERSGALYDCLTRAVDGCDNGLVVVPGGGGFADQVRTAQARWHFDDATAHAMAILAMQQMAFLFNALKPELKLADTCVAIRRTTETGRPALWSPALSELAAANIEAGWHVTSDSLAAWLAAELGADELILIKSAPIPANIGISALCEQGIVDAAFARFVSRANYKVTIINKDRFNAR
ncbi:MAG: amino acid kinase family protein [Gammaproteobacteria bacterium]